MMKENCIYLVDEGEGYCSCTETGNYGKKNNNTMCEFCTLGDHYKPKEG